MAESVSAACIDRWGEYFARSGVDVFEIIERTMMVAASDHPKEFKNKREDIAHALFTCKFIDPSECDKCVNSRDNLGRVDYKPKSYEEIDTLLNDMEKETQMVGAVIRIKGILVNNEDVSESKLYNSLKKLQLMNLGVGTLIETKIGESIDALQNHASNDVSGIARKLVQEWKDTFNQWLDVKEKMLDHKCNIDFGLNEWDGLFCPPLDDYAFINPQLTLPIMQLSTFFDGIDDDDNIAKGIQLKKIIGLPVEKDKPPNQQQQNQLRGRKKQTMVQRRQSTTEVIKVKNSAKSRALKRGSPWQRSEQPILYKEKFEDKLEAAIRTLREGHKRARNTKRRPRTLVIC